jgi:hypothetical protein
MNKKAERASYGMGRAIEGVLNPEIVPQSLLMKCH